MKQDIPKIAKVVDVTKHCDDVITIYLEGKAEIKPGQFIMLWLPGVDEKPFTISQVMENRFGITVRKKGEFTKALFDMKNGDKLGYRGPYGRGYSIVNGKNVCIIGGGVGMAELNLLYHKLKDKNKVFINYGAKTKSELVFDFPQAFICTDDGSAGMKGFVTDILEELLKKEKIDIVYTCGPEIMMRKVVEICNRNKINCEVSLERYMKCGFGICGNCAVNGKLVCKDGPVFNSKDLATMNDFGSFARLKTGKKARL